MKKYRSKGNIPEKSWRVTSEPGDHTKYDYFVIEYYDEYIFAPRDSTFPFPQKLNWYGVKDIKTLDDAIKFIKTYKEFKDVNPHTLLECINCIRDIKGETPVFPE